MSTRTRLVLTSLAIVVVAAAGVWWFFLRSDAPPPVNLDDAIAAATSSTIPGTAPPSTDTDIEGAWAILPGEGSFVGYRVQEELATIGFTEAAGRTDALAARLQIEGGRVVTVEIAVDMRRLRSNSDRRDGALRTQALETDAFPDAAFMLTEPITLPDAAPSGRAFEVTAVGDLTLHGVTRQVELSLDAQFVDGVIAVVGSTDILFADYDIDQPRSLALLSVDDRGLMEFQLLFERG